MSDEETTQIDLTEEEREFLAWLSACHREYLEFEDDGREEQLALTVAANAKLNADVDCDADPTETPPEGVLFPERIRGWRVAKGLTQAEMADLMDVTVVTIRNWEHGRHIPQGEAAEILREKLTIDDE